jgi:hypothetical protein
MEYLPLIRVVPVGEGYLAWLSPAELARVRHLAQPGQDPDDVPSAVLACCSRRSSCPKTASPCARSTATQTCPATGNG